MAAPDQDMQSPRLPRLPGSAKMAGVEYEYKMAGLVALRARRAKLSFQLFTNVRAVRPFDDLVLRVLQPRSALFLVQLKHSDARKKITAQALTAPSGDFSLLKYFALYDDPPRSFKRGAPLTAEEEQLQEAMRGEGVQLVMYTNNDAERAAEGAPPASAEDPFLASRLRELFVEGTEGAEDAARVLAEDLLRTDSGDPANVFSFDVTDREVWQLMKTHGKEQKEDSYQEDFLSKFVLFSRQSHADFIDDLILAELKQLFGGEVHGADRFLEQYLKFLKAWARDDSRDHCLSERSPQLQMERLLAGDFRQSARAGAGAFAFGDGACAGLRAALGRSRERLLRWAVPGLPPGLRAAKAQQVLDEDFSEKWTYIDDAILEEYPKAALLLACRSCDVVVLDTNKGIHEDELGKLTENTKIVVILCANDSPDPSQHTELDYWRMEDLKKEVQEEILERTVLFQGRPVPLRHLEGAWPRLRAEVDGALLGALARGEAVLGAAPSAPDDDGPHVPRKWEHHALLDASVLEMNQPTEHLVLSGFDEEVAKELRQRCGVTENEIDRWTLLPEGEGEAAFQKVACMHRNKNVHWVHLLGGRTLSDAVLQWRATERQEAALAAFALSPCERQPLCEHEGPPWGAGTLLLVGAAGAGKTCALRRAAAEARERAPARWAVYVELLTHRSFLRQLPPAHEILLDHAVDLLAAAAGVTAGASRRHLLAALSVKGGAAIFIDGVDEVSPVFKDRVLRLLSVLKQNTDNPIWVSCRPEVEETLLQELRCTATRLRALSREEQRRFLCERWAATHSTSPPEFSSFADKTIDALRQASDSLLDVPLHLSMAAEVLAAEAAQSPDTVFQQNVFILLMLYGRFVQMKRDIYLERHELKYAFENLNIRDDFEEMHKNCAMLILLLDSEEYENIHKFKTYVAGNIDILRKEKSGMLWVDGENNPHFAHFTFAEFFCARWLFEHKGDETAKELTECLLLKRHKSLALRFLELMLVEDVHPRVQLPLHEALLADSKRDGEGVARALEEGARVDGVDGGGRTALHVAAWRGNWRAMEALLEAGCDFHVSDFLLGWTPFQYALSCGYVFIFRRKDYTSLEFFLAEYEEPIHSYLCQHICLNNWAKAALWLLEGSTRCLYGEMLSTAVSRNARKVARAVLEDGAGACGARGERQQVAGEGGVCPRGGDHQRATAEAAHQALVVGHAELALELLEHVSHVEDFRWRGSAALHFAADGCLLRVTKRLLGKGADARSRDPSGREPLHRVFSNDVIPQPDDEDRAHYVQHFLEMLQPSTRSDITNARDDKGRTPLHLAVDACNVKATESLLSYGSDPNAADCEHSTPLQMAVKKRYPEVVKVLLEHGANPSLTDMREQQPLSYLYSLANSIPTEEIAKEIASMLLDKYADPNCHDKYG